MNQQAREQHCAVLGVTSDATVDEVHTAFRQLSKAAHPDAGGSREDFDRLVDARIALLKIIESDGVVDDTRVYLSSTGEPLGQHRAKPQRPVWVPGAVLALVVGGAAGIVGVVQLDRAAMVLGLVIALAIFVSVTAFQVVRRVHARNTTVSATYKSAEDVIKLRNRS